MTGFVQIIWSEARLFRRLGGSMSFVSLPHVAQMRWCIDTATAQGAKQVRSDPKSKRGSWARQVETAH